MMVNETRLLRGGLEPEQEYAGLLVRDGRLGGFLSIRRTVIEVKRSRRDAVTLEEAVRWRIATSPWEPWNEGYSPLREVCSEVSVDTFRYIGVPYDVRWADKDLAPWIQPSILGPLW